MKTKAGLIIPSSLAILATLLSSCSKKLTFIEFTDYLAINDNYKEIVGDNFIKPSSYRDISFIDIDGNNRLEPSFQSLTRYLNKNNEVGGNYVIDSIGEQKFLVVPVSFKDYPSTKLKNPNQSIVDIQNAFFGSDGVNQYYSVASFYNKSSYGKLKIKGEVLPSWFETSVTYQELKDNNNSLLVDKIYQEVLSFVKNNVSDISTYYVNNDERLGLPIYMIYDAPNDIDASDALWAFTKNADSNFYSWTSLEMIDVLKNRGTTDAHVLIHETGHLLGLQDYYPESGNYSPLGKCDMMDYSIGDHSAFSKMLLNWTRPYYVNGSTTISINPFESSGDVILLNNDWNGTAMDEYIVIEYYTPTNLHSYDVKYGATDGENVYKMMSQAGIRIYHIDARLGYYSIRSGVSCYIEEGIPSNPSKVGIANSNHKLFGNNPLYQLLQKGGQNTFVNGDSTQNEDLFVTGDTFGVDTYKDYTFHNGNKLGYSVKIKELGLDKAVIEIQKI